LKRPNNERARRLTRKRAKRAEAHHAAKRHAKRRRWLERYGRWGWGRRPADRADIPKVEPAKAERNTGRVVRGEAAGKSRGARRRARSR